MKMIFKPRSWFEAQTRPGATIEPHATAMPDLLTRRGFHRYFIQRLTGYACDREDLMNWRRLHQFTACRLTPGAANVRAAYA